MTDRASYSEPQWGRDGRDRKAEALFNTLLSRCGPGIAAGCWADLGCGSGGIVAELAGRVRWITGIDPEPWAAWAQAAAVHPNLSFIEAPCDTTELPLAQASVDVAICNQVYEHVADPRRLVLNLGYILKPGGWCYFAGPNLLWPIEPHVFWPFVHWLPRQLAHSLMRLAGARRPEDLDACSTHVWKLRRWFEEAGLDWVDAVPARAAAGLAMAGHLRLARMVECVPSPAWIPLRPLWPGFVFILHKHARPRVDA
ncbi:MAG: methyltransferase domain-containing protein [Rhodocyclaceae bacterium]|nr:class I SAM-dependent methyltransferase [Rhodocyclaceae bacterium]MCL4758877.1 methyltransferase domain-containing protein [Rhodocyclaceae bacterium]